DMVDEREPRSRHARAHRDADRRSGRDQHAQRSGVGHRSAEALGAGQARMRALILDCDGVLAETERDLHLPSFNRAFAEAGLPVRWSSAEYGRLLAIGGGKERIATYLREHGLAGDPAEG